MHRLQIHNPRERALVSLADLVLAPAAWWPRRRPPVMGRILVLRLERIGDLLMTLEAIADVRAAWPEATIDLAVGSWNAEIARLVPGISTVQVMDVPWLSRGERATSWPAILRKAHAWAHQYDLVINFEPDIRSNVLAWLSRAPVRLGYASGGGGSLLTTVGTYDPTRHVADNARSLVATIAPPPPRTLTESRQLRPSPVHAARAGELLDGRRRPFVGVHVSGGRQSKQWHPDRFAEVARIVARETGGTIVLTGSSGDRPLVDAVREQLHDVPVVDAAGALDLPATAALVGSLDVMITGDTGPMHLTAAMGAPVVALFGPSDANRYGPRARAERVVRVQLPCSPCGQVRLPPERCRGHVPDCMDGIPVAAVVDAALELLGRRPVRTEPATPTW